MGNWICIYYWWKRSNDAFATRRLHFLLDLKFEFSGAMLEGAPLYKSELLKITVELKYKATEREREGVGGFVGRAPI